MTNLGQKMVPLYSCTAIMVPTMSGDLTLNAMYAFHVRAVIYLLTNAALGRRHTAIIPQLMRRPLE
jgi:hypothetical protein